MAARRGAPRKRDFHPVVGMSLDSVVGIDKGPYPEHPSADAAGRRMIRLGEPEPRLLYVFAIAFTQLTRGTQCGAQYFMNVPASMQSLFISGALLDDIGSLMHDLLDEGLYTTLALMYVFVIMSSITVLC